MEILEQVQKYGYVREAVAPEVDLVAEINRLRKEKMPLSWRIIM